MGTPVPGGRCTCPVGCRFYVALSAELNDRAYDGRAGALTPFVFKVGSTKICRDRIASLNQNRKPMPAGGSTVFGEPAYAGAVDWRILRCWDVAVDRYDDKVFKGWLADAHDPGDVRSLGRRTFPGIDGLSPAKGFDDLCFVSENFVRRRAGVRANHPLHEEMLQAAVDAVVEIAARFAEGLQWTMPNAA